MNAIRPALQPALRFGETEYDSGIVRTPEEKAAMLQLTSMALSACISKYSNASEKAVGFAENALQHLKAKGFVAFA